MVDTNKCMCLESKNDGRAKQKYVCHKATENIVPQLTNKKSRNEVGRFSKHEGRSTQHNLEYVLATAARD